jgi:hypothetical protein
METVAPAIDLSQYTQAEKDALRRTASIQASPQLPFSADGYKTHYYALFSHYLPPFAWDWIQEFFEYWDKGVRRFGFKAHRGATKSTIWTIGFSSYVLAKFPQDGVLIVQKSDTAAGKTSMAVADLIENNVGWRTMYPHLIPDKQKRWAFEGYEIQDSSIPYNEWRQKVLDRRPKDNSFVGYGWSNGGIVGMHPNWLFVDDIHDEENTRSKREMKGVADTMKGNVLQTLNRPPDVDRNDEPTCIFSYTPWYADDFYAYIESTRLYHIMETPLISEVAQGVPGSFEWRSKYWKCAWPSKNPAKLVQDKVIEYGEMDFARMQLLDLTKAQGMNLKREWLHEFPMEKINPSWPVYMGVDYASSADKQKMDNHDYFSVSIGRAIPSGGVILIDGFRDKLSQGEAEEKLKALVQNFPGTVLIGFDRLGKGYDSMWNLINSGLPIVPCPRDGEGKRSKGEKFEGSGGLGYCFQFSSAFISDAETPFLKAFKDEWVQWPGGTNDDTLDSTYNMLYIAQGFLMQAGNNDVMGVQKLRQKKGFGQIAKELRHRQ